MSINITSDYTAVDMLICQICRPLATNTMSNSILYSQGDTSKALCGMTCQF